MGERACTKVQRKDVLSSPSFLFHWWCECNHHNWGSHTVVNVLPVEKRLEMGQVGCSGWSWPYILATPIEYTPVVVVSPGQPSDDNWFLLVWGHLVTGSSEGSMSFDYIIWIVALTTVYVTGNCPALSMCGGACDFVSEIFTRARHPLSVL